MTEEEEEVESMSDPLITRLSVCKEYPSQSAREQ